MKVSELRGLKTIHDATILGLPGNYSVQINGQSLDNKRRERRRFITADAAVRTLARCGIHGARLILCDEGNAHV